MKEQETKIQLCKFSNWTEVDYKANYKKKRDQ